MDLATNLKRKKLKTRKCLNKLRKRLFGESDKDISIDGYSVLNKNYSEEYFNTKPNSMTMSHLTSAFLSKAVQSETITRHTLPSKQEKSGTSKNVNDASTMIFNESESSLSQPSIASDNSYNVINPLTEVITTRDNDFFYKSLSRSPSLFSSHKSDRTMVSFIEGLETDSVENLRQSVTSVKSLKNDRQGFGNSLFEKLSHEIIIEENPTTYIKLGHTKYVAASSGVHSSTSTSRSNSPLCRSNFSHVSAACVDDTPEYIYYPHRLNQ
ncbi:PREDICTED: uncharacterized protein LOC106117664 [Papilio xuthus]|uniref:Uncharacterized protein LOC106117664 n=1 Tax=Papilio xuthus TaxID=66420 RepID=A0AAJ6Z8Z2_PAPXU|nr:PREDICTED: uncharacterized protein LOC106117664 [Papilio xuthus]